MDLVPLDFSERVSATWKCCESGGGCDCVVPVFSTRKWTFLNATNASFVVSPYARGEWKYSFRLDSRIDIDMTMIELLEHPDFKNLRINGIQIKSSQAVDRMKPVSDVGMEKLLKFVSFLANEPTVFIDSQNASEFSSPEGALLLSWLEQRWFSDIFFCLYHSAFNQLLRNQSSRGMPTRFFFNSVIGDNEVFAEQLRSGQMTRLQANSSVFSSDVMEGIAQSFLRCPSAKELGVCATFDDSTEDQLREMAERGLCKRVDGKFIFENPFHRLVVSRPPHAPDSSSWECWSY